MIFMHPIRALLTKKKQPLRITGMRFIYTLLLPAFSAYASFVVKVETVSKHYDYDCPWKAPTPRSHAGSGCLIDNRYILTNAHVIADAAYIEITLEGESTSYPCHIAHCAHDCDLAFLVADDPAFYLPGTPLTLGELPHAGDQVTALGYPMGGMELSHTQGIISRTEFQPSAYSGLPILLTQLDAAINPGNSGGPVIKDRSLVGTVCQLYMGSQNLGYMIPSPVIKRCLRDIQVHGTYQGIPSLPFAWQPLNNKDLKRYLKLDARQEGVLITHSLSSFLETDDILLKIDNTPIHSNGTFDFSPRLKLSLNYLIYGKIIDDPLSLTILREGKERTISIQLETPLLETSLVPPGILERAPHYFIHGGIVFQGVNENYLNLYEHPPHHLLNHYFYSSISDERDQLVMINTILPHPCNAGYPNMSTEIVETINDTPVRNLAHLTELIENNHMPFLIIELETGNKLIFDRAHLTESNEDILNLYGIHEDRSHDL